MRTAFQIAGAILIGLGTIYAGVMNFYAPAAVMEQYFGIDLSAYDSDLQLAITTQVRVLAGLWVAAGIFVCYAIIRIEENTVAFRLVVLGLALSALGELATVLAMDGNRQAALVKASLQIGVCVILELWRIYLIKTQHKR